MATQSALEKDGQWLDSAVGKELDDGEDLKAARLLRANILLNISRNTDIHDAHISQLEGMRDDLDAFIKLSENLRSLISQSLNTATSS